jgi:hypothetical protein
MDTGASRADTETEASEEPHTGSEIFEECQGLEKELLAAAFLEEVDVRLLPIESLSVKRMARGQEKLGDISTFDGVHACLRALHADAEED